MISAIRPQPIFRPGQLVRHRRYGYRGVVVDCDPLCRASEAWYRKNQTRPDRDQPWYHVLVHGSQITTYAAQSSLTEDDSAQPIDHPLVGQFFDEFTGDGYRRNQRPWQL
jgi:heat shock protein HspQ